MILQTLTDFMVVKLDYETNQRLEERSREPYNGMSRLPQNYAENRLVYEEDKQRQNIQARRQRDQRV